MFDLVLELLRVLVEIPRIGFVGKPSVLPFDVDELEQNYKNLSEEDKQWFEDCWREFCVIVIRQNELHKDALSLSHKLACRLRDDLEAGGAQEVQEAGEDEADKLREEIWDLVSELPGERLAEVLAYVRGMAGGE